MVTSSLPVVEARTMQHRKLLGVESMQGQKSTSGVRESFYMSCFAAGSHSKMKMCRCCSRKSAVSHAQLSIFVFLILCGTEGTFHLPSYLSPEAKNLITSMLVVDPVKRITVPEITQHPFFTTNLPRYLTPLPPPPGPVLGTLSSLVGPAKQLDFEMIEGLGRIEEDVVEELADTLDGVSLDEVWACLRRDDGVQGNAVKVAYMLLRDKRRLGKDCEYFFPQWQYSILTIYSGDFCRS